MTSEDPAICSYSRDLRSGETAPYRLTDFDKANGGKRYQAVSSVPLTDGTVRIEKRMGEDFPASFDPERDGYDLLEQEGEFVSFIRTHDPQCGEQHLSGAGDGDGWLLFPNRGGLTAGGGRQDMTLERLAPPPACPFRERTSRVPDRQIVAVWTAPQDVTFESGKTLRAIVSEHRAHHDLARWENAIERFYFTREYGWSRWEAWIPKRRCLDERGSDDPLKMCDPTDPANFLRGRCTPASATARWGGQDWIRSDCRDTTFHEPRS